MSMTMPENGSDTEIDQMLSSLPPNGSLPGLDSMPSALPSGPSGASFPAMGSTVFPASISEATSVPPLPSGASESAPKAIASKTAKTPPRKLKLGRLLREGDGLRNLFLNSVVTPATSAAAERWVNKIFRMDVPGSIKQLEDWGVIEASIKPAPPEQTPRDDDMLRMRPWTADERDKIEAHIQARIRERTEAVEARGISRPRSAAQAGAQKRRTRPVDKTLISDFKMPPTHRPKSPDKTVENRIKEQKMAEDLAKARTLIQKSNTLTREIKGRMTGWVAEGEKQVLDARWEKHQNRRATADKAWDSAVQPYMRKQRAPKNAEDRFKSGTLDTSKVAPIPVQKMSTIGSYISARYLLENSVSSVAQKKRGDALRRARSKEGDFDVTTVLGDPPGSPAS